MFRSLPGHSIDQAPYHLELGGSPHRFILLLPISLFSLSFYCIGILNPAVEV
jgi:hypothetical protein